MCADLFSLPGFEFATAGRIVFGPGKLNDLGALAQAVWEQAGSSTTERTENTEKRGGKRVVVALGAEAVGGRVEAALKQAGFACLALPVQGEPTLAGVQEGVERARDFGAELVIGVGGGAAIDTGKAIAALLTNPGDPLDYLEVVGQGRPLAQPPRPFIAVPTTAGTGAEVTRNAVLGVAGVKVSLRSPLMLPRLALVDPELTLTLPPEATAASGMDALTQLIEPYVCKAPVPLVDALCAYAIPLAAQALPIAYAHPADLKARSAMSLAALFSGMALANAKLGAVHGFAGVLGGMYGAPHGAICARLLPEATEVNLRALSQRQPDHPALARYAQAAVWVTGDPAATPADLIAHLHRLADTLSIPGLAAYGVAPQDFPAILPQAARASSMQGNPIALAEAEMAEILERAL
jgi:alcohol dehydrogenase class IV